MIENLERKMREESEDKKEMSVSEKWREKHEERMGNVGVVRGVERERERERERESEETIREIPRLEEKEKANSLGEGWEW